jgi:hypothetical protein
MVALGLPNRPSHFAAFMPETLEKKLFDLEKAHARGRQEDDIAKTIFRVKRAGNAYEPVFDSINFK